MSTEPTAGVRERLVLLVTVLQVGFLIDDGLAMPDSLMKTLDGVDRRAAVVQLAALEDVGSAPTVDEFHQALLALNTPENDAEPLAILLHCNMFDMLHKAALAKGAMR